MIVPCAHCQQLFETFALHAKMTPRRFCSPQCAGAHRKPASFEDAFLLRMGQFPETARCWDWTGHVSSTGKAVVTWGRKKRSAGRVAYAIFHGPLGNEDLVLRTCDNALCCNPRHLHKGTVKDRNDKARPLPQFFRCEQCRKRYRAHKSHVENGTRKHCSRRCAQRARLEQALSLSVADRFRQVMGQPPNSDACWEWEGPRMNKGGYGVISTPIEKILAHRAAYEIFHGPVTAGLFVCHRCDNPPCCNPRHLFAGTPNDNIQDAIQKGRHAKGERLPQAKLTEADVRVIRLLSAQGFTLTNIADRFGITNGAVSMIKNRKRWKHVS